MKWNLVLNTQCTFIMNICLLKEPLQLKFISKCRLFILMTVLTWVLIICPGLEERLDGFPPIHIYYVLSGLPYYNFLVWKEYTFHIFFTKFLITCFVVVFFILFCDLPRVSWSCVASKTESNKCIKCIIESKIYCKYGELERADVCIMHKVDNLCQQPSFRWESLINWLRTIGRSFKGKWLSNLTFHRNVWGPIIDVLQNQKVWAR